MIIKLSKKKGSHSFIASLIMTFFIISLGLGESFAIGGIKIIYIFTSLVLLVFIAQRKIIRRRKTEELKFLDFCFLWVLYGAIQYFWAIDKSIWMFFYRSLLINVLVVLIIFSFVQTLDDWVLVAKAFTVSIAISLLVGFWEILTGQHLFVEDYSKMNSNTVMYYLNKPSTFFGNVNDYASVLFLGLIIITILFIICREERNTMYRRAARILSYLIAVSSVIYQIIVTSSRGAILSLPLFLFTLFGFYYFNKLLKDKSVFKKNAVLTAIIILSVIFVLLFLSFNSIETFGVNSSGDLKSNQTRILLIKRAFDAFLNTFGFGVGPGQTVAINGINLHSFYLEVLFEYGVLIGGYVVFTFFRLAYASKIAINETIDAIVKSFPIVLLVLGLSSSKLFSIRLTWVTFALIFSIKYNNFSLPSRGTKK